VGWAERTPTAQASTRSKSGLTLRIKPLSLAPLTVASYHTESMEQPRYTPNSTPRPIAETVTSKKRETNKDLANKAMGEVVEPIDARTPEEIRKEIQEVNDLIAAGSDWRNFARCLTADPEIFFPTIGRSDKDAKKICARCNVKEHCLLHALSTNQGVGVWGGLNAEERRGLKRRGRRR
jgi:WhiB family redox-sensing transcriptional regulator